MECYLMNIAFILVIFFSTQAHAFPNGKVELACITMIPQHGADPQTSVAPYRLTFSNTTYTGKNAYIVTLSKSGSSDFKGFLIQAREPSGSTPLGSFVVNGSDVQTLDCTTAQSAVSHTSNSPKSSIQVIWLPPSPSSTSNIQFRATVVEARPTFWTNILSDKVISHGPGLLAPALSHLLLYSSVLVYALLSI